MDPLALGKRERANTSINRVRLVTGASPAVIRWRKSSTEYASYTRSLFVAKHPLQRPAALSCPIVSKGTTQQAA